MSARTLAGIARLAQRIERGARVAGYQVIIVG